MVTWKTIQGIPKYKINRFGEIKSYHFGREHFLRPEIDKYGYERVVLCNDGHHTRKLVHRLVAEHFKAKIPGYEHMTIDHINGNKRDNRPENLEWVSSSENLKRAHKDGRYDSIHIKQSTPIWITDLWTGEETYYDSLAAAATGLEIPKASLFAALNRSNNVISHYSVEKAEREERLLYGSHFNDC